VGQRGVNRNDDRLSLMFYLHRILHIHVHIRTRFNASIVTRNLHGCLSKDQFDRC
jgi:hypothetical protein